MPIIIEILRLKAYITFDRKSDQAPLMSRRKKLKSARKITLAR